MGVTETESSRISEPSTLNADDLINAIGKAWADRLKADRFALRPPSPYIYASRIRSCTRAMSLDVTVGTEESEFTVDSLARMQKGKEREEAIVAWLMQIGPRCSPRFKVIEGQKRFEIKDRDGTVIIVGKVDCRLQFENGEKPFVEVKSGEGVKGVESLEDFDRSPWIRHHPDQLLAYLYAENQPWGLFVLDRPGLPQFIRVSLEDNLARVERVLGQVRRALDVKLIDAPLPPYIEDRAECKRCAHWGKSCNPSMDFGPGVPILTDQLLVQAAETRDRTRGAHEEYEAADKLLKERLRGVEMALFGDYQAIGRWSSLKTYPIPPEVKEQYLVVKEQGQFRLKVEKIA